ncbi:11826_t:CDS:2, partial [Dentiscutata heterogama]
PVFNDIVNTLETLNLPDPMQVDEFLEIPDENVVYEVLSDKEVIRELVKIFKTNSLTIINMKNMEDKDDSIELSIQDNMEEYINILRKIEKFINKTK